MAESNIGEARADLAAARAAGESGDDHRRRQYAQSAVDSASSTVLDPGADKEDVAAARQVLSQAITVRDQSLDEAERQWHQRYLDTRKAGHQSADTTRSR